VGGEGLHRQPCRDLLQAVGDGGLEAVTNTEVLQEILHVRARRLGIKDAVVAVRAASDLVREVLPSDGRMSWRRASFSNDITVWEHAMPCTPQS